jgi:hypothetical protein
MRWGFQQINFVDPEEFLNMMFKHTLLVPPFISIRYEVVKCKVRFVMPCCYCRRPFGVEEEYFVQLFLEMDETQKLPSIGDLVCKMFSEQNISFTEVLTLSPFLIFDFRHELLLDPFEVTDSGTTVWKEISNFSENNSSQTHQCCQECGLEESS